MIQPKHGFLFLRTIDIKHISANNLSSFEILCQCFKRLPRNVVLVLRLTVSRSGPSKRGLCLNVGPDTVVVLRKVD